MKRFASTILACAFSVAAFAASGPKIMNLSLTAPATTLNAHVTEMSEIEIIDYVQGCLYQWVPSADRKTHFLDAELAAGKPIPGQDGTSWTIKIDPQAKWANGERITADSFVYSWKMALDPKMLNTPGGSTCGKNYIAIKNAIAYYTQTSTGKAISWAEVGVKKVDDQTLSIVTDGRYTQQEVMQHFAWRTTGPVYEKLYEAGMDASRRTTQYGTSLEKYMPSGPFKLKSWASGADIVLERNPNYLRTGIIKLDGMKWRVVADAGARLQLFEKGELDYVPLSANTLAKYEDDPRLVTYDTPNIRCIEINRTNPDKPILRNKNFLAALYYAMDRQAMAKLVYGIPAPLIVSTRSLALDDGTKFRELAIAKANVPANNGYDPKLAKEYFDKAMAEERLDKLTLQINYFETIDATKVMSEYLQKRLVQVFGADKFELKLQGAAKALDIMKASIGKEPASYELSWMGWSLTAEAFSPAAKFQVYTSDSSRRVANYGNKEIDVLYARAIDDAVRGDKEEVAKLAARMERIFRDEVLSVPVIQVQNFVLISDRIKTACIENQPGFATWGWEFADIL